MTDFVSMAEEIIQKAYEKEKYVAEHSAVTLALKFILKGDGYTLSEFKEKVQFILEMSERQDARKGGDSE